MLLLIMTLLETLIFQLHSSLLLFVFHIFKRKCGEDCADIITSSIGTAPKQKNEYGLCSISKLSTLFLKKII